MPTRVIILTPAALHREAWRALLSGQPHIGVAGSIADPSSLGPLLQPGQPTTILIDVPKPQPDLARQLNSAAPDCGQVFLVQSYDLGAVLALLQAGATGCVSRDASVGDLARAITPSIRE